MKMLKVLLFMVAVITKKVYADGELNILMLGGNGMLGSATVQSILGQSGDVNLTLLSRGNWYWDTEDLIKPYVTHVKCYRGEGFQDECPIAFNGVVYDTIIDFSSYDPLDVEDILVVLKGRFNHYIYISSDSVYEVCQEKQHDGANRENDAIRPGDDKLRVELASKDSYGNRKLEGEEVLAKYHDILNYDYILLRLPDVFGPRDNTHRFWKYYMWTKLHQIIGPVHVPLEIKNEELSFVYSEDVGKLIASLLREEKKEIRNNAYNLAFKTSVTFKDFIKEIMQCLNLDLAEDEIFDESESAYLNFGIPSVTKGPVSTDKAEKLLNWQPSDFSKAVKETCKFYEEAQYTLKYKFMLDIVLDKLGVRGEKYRDYLEHHFDKMQKMEL